MNEVVYSVIEIHKVQRTYKAQKGGLVYDDGVKFIGK